VHGQTTLLKIDSDGTYGHRTGVMLDSCAMTKGHASTGTKLELLQGTLDLMVLQTLDTMGPQHGYGIARRIEQMSNDILKLNEGTVYAALMRLQHRRWISANWGTSEANRKAKFYAITVAGKRQLAREVEAWDQLAGLVARLRGAEQS
jgi:PadR family transcriptional regulator, regulatory protein PadR